MEVSKFGKTIALADLGADISAVRSSMLKGQPHVTFCTSPRLTITSADGSTIDSRGSCVLKIRLNKSRNFVPYEFVVIDSLSEDVILGEDFLRTYGATIDLNENTLILKRQYYDSKFDPTPKNLDQLTRCETLSENPEEVAKIDSPIERFYAIDSVTIRPNSIARVRVRMKGQTDQKELIMEPASALILKKDVTFPRCLVTISKGESSVFIENHTNANITIPRLMHIAGGQDTGDETSVPVLAALSGKPTPPRETFTNVHKTTPDVSTCIDKRLKRDERAAIENILRQFTTLFPKKNDPPRQTHLVTHRINTGTHTPIRCRYNKRYAPAEREIIASEVKKMLDHGIVRPSESPWSSPVVLVRKKDGSVRFCVDYRELNKITKRDSYPLPRVDDALDCLSGSKFFSTLDLKSGYHQCPVEESDREKTAFVTPDGLFEFNTMPFGLCNGPSSFERLMDSVLRGRRWKHCLIYLDDLCVFGKTLEEHNERLRDVLGCLDQANLSLNYKKCVFGASSVTILGHEISHEGVMPEASKTSAIRSFPTPTTQKAVRSFLGLASYYRRFIENFAKMAAPLNRLLKDGVKFEWTTGQQSAFDALRSRLINPPILGHFDPSAPITLRTDACGHGIGSILAQTDVKGRERVIAYASRTLSNAEARYSTTDQEGLAIIWAIKKFRPYAYARKITVVTDHHALCWIMSAKNLTGRLARWALQLQEYDIEIVYKQGRKHLDADCLSRYPEGWKETANATDSRNTQTSSSDPPTPDAAEIHTEPHAPTIAAINLQNMADLQRNDRSLDKFWKNQENSASFEVISGILYKRNFSRRGDTHLLVLPQSLRREALNAAHTDREGGHMGIAKTFGKISQRYYWPRAYADSERFVKTCSECQQRRRDPQKYGLLQHIETPQEIFHTIGIDLLSFNPTEKGNRVIVTAICHLSKFLITKALPNGSAEHVARFVVEDVILRYGAPRVIISDQGKVFLSEMMKNVNKLFKVEHRKTSCYHPQSNGLTERSHRTIADMLSKYVDRNITDWDDLLPFVTHAYNTAPQKSTRFSPFYIVHGVEATSTFDAALPPAPVVGGFTTMVYVEGLQGRLEEARQLARDLADRAKEDNKSEYDKGKTNRQWKIGERVLIHFPFRKLGQSDKLQKCHFGPYRVTEQKGPETFEVVAEHDAVLPGPRAMRQVAHASRMKPFHDDNRNENPAPTIEPDDQTREEPEEEGEPRDEAIHQVETRTEMEREKESEVTEQTASSTPEPDGRRTGRRRQPPQWSRDYVLQ